MKPGLGGEVGDSLDDGVLGVVEVVPIQVENKFVENKLELFINSRTLPRKDVRPLFFKVCLSRGANRGSLHLFSLTLPLSQSSSSKPRYWVSY